jgi:hypothetical protein
LNTRDNNVIATTTALAYPRNTPNKPDVCIVRLLVSLYMPVDVNLDLVVNDTDVNLVQSSPFYTIFLNQPSPCPQNDDDQHICGRADVNFDGLVNPLDVTAITQSAVLGTSMPCGGVFATAFSCGSSRTAPLTPAVDISLDSIVYFNNDGEHGAVAPLRKRAPLDNVIAQTILVDFERMQDDLLSLKRTVSTHTAAISSVERQIDSKVSEVTARVATYEQQQQQQQHQQKTPGHSRELLMAASAAVAVILCGALVYAITRR